MMITIRDFITTQQNTFSKHAFFDIIANQSSLDLFAKVMPKMAFWIFTFQDILRLNEALVKDPAYVEIVHMHRMEDAGHEIWFLNDYLTLNKLKGNFQPKPLDARMLFHPTETEVRDASFGLISEIFRIEDDRLRVLLMLVLESSGHVFFAKIASAMQKLSIDSSLQYFSSSHLCVEQAHTCFGDDIETQINAINLTPELEKAGCAMITRMYRHFSSMFDGLTYFAETVLSVSEMKEVA